MYHNDNIIHYIYIYIYTSLSLYIHIYIYIYVYTHNIYHLPVSCRELPSGRGTRSSVQRPTAAAHSPERGVFVIVRLVLGIVLGIVWEC